VNGALKDAVLVVTHLNLYKFNPFRMNYIMQNYEMDKNGAFRHKTNSKESPMQDFVITKQKYRKVSIIEIHQNRTFRKCSLLGKKRTCSMRIHWKNTEQIQIGSFLECFNSERSCKIKLKTIKSFLNLVKIKIYIFWEKS